MDKITIYTTKTCDYCKQMKDELEKENIQFEEKITENFKDDFQEVVNLTNMAITPTIEYKNEYFIAGRDYINPKQLIEILKVFKNSKYSNTKIIIERLKTLNYNIASAFSKFDQVMKKIETKLNIKENEHKSTN
tara:strand:- start:50 stop:451 length:402 start_codon:yes stop_codon:yes gene_type:complete